MNSERPVIGVPWPRADYVAALTEAGADARELTPGGHPVPGALDSCDGLLLTGGADVDPFEYGETERHSTVTLDEARDDYELALAREALASDVPVLAICRGAQVLNVAAGGTLIQDLPSHHTSALAHSVEQPKDAIAHDVSVVPGSCVATLLAGQLDERGRMPVNSRHHQSVLEVAPGLVATASAPDGVIEAIEKTDAAFCIGVQWHPENFRANNQFGGLFAGLVAAARRRRTSRRI